LQPDSFLPRNGEIAARKMVWRHLRQAPKLASMDGSQKRKSRLEIGNVLFIDIAGYSTLK
jgi:hypothetical protein